MKTNRGFATPKVIDEDQRVIACISHPPDYSAFVNRVLSLFNVGIIMRSFFPRLILARSPSRVSNPGYN